MGATVTPRTPQWVAPDIRQVADEHWLAYNVLTESLLPWAAGVASSMPWVRGLRTGPITERDEQPVTRNIADAERWAAESVRDQNHPPPMHLIYQTLKVALATPTVTDVNYAVGVWRTLRWLLGIPGQAPPLEVPQRHVDGRLYTLDDIYRVLTGGDDRHLPPEQRITIRQKASLRAAQYLPDGQITAIQEKLSAS